MLKSNKVMAHRKTKTPFKSFRLRGKSVSLPVFYVSGSLAVFLLLSGAVLFAQPSRPVRLNVARTSVQAHTPARPQPAKTQPAPAAPPPPPTPAPQTTPKPAAPVTTTRTAPVVTPAPSSNVSGLRPATPPAP